MHKRAIYGIILAGGSGKRLWPLSRCAVPKQFVKLSSKSLLEVTIDRCQMLATFGHELNLALVTTREHEHIVQEVLNQKTVQVLVEPVARNTAAAMLFALLSLKLQGAKNNDIIFFVPSDHVIGDLDQFIEKLDKAIRYASLYNSIILLGVKPDFPATCYGYIKKDKHCRDDLYTVNGFFEKPTAAGAAQFIQERNILWNTGIFCAPLALFLQEFETQVPALMTAMAAYFNGNYSYEQIPAYSFDKAVLEKSAKLLVVESDIGWSDVGNVEQFVAARQEPEQPHIVSYKSKNNIVDVKNKLVVLSDVQDLCIVETDDILFISKRGRMADGEHALGLLDYLKKNGYERYL